MMTNDRCHDVMMMLPDGGDTGGGPGQDDPKVDEGEAGEEAVNMQRKCHHKSLIVNAILSYTVIKDIERRTAALLIC